MNIDFDIFECLGKKFLCITERQGVNNAALAKSILSKNFTLDASELVVIQKSKAADFNVRTFAKSGQELRPTSATLAGVAKFCYDAFGAKTLIIENRNGVTYTKMIKNHINDAVMEVDAGSFQLLPTNQKNGAQVFLDQTGSTHVVMFVDNFNFIPEQQARKFKLDNLSTVSFAKVTGKNALSVTSFNCEQELPTICDTGICASAMAYAKNSPANIRVHSSTAHALVDCTNPANIKIISPVTQTQSGTITLNPTFFTSKENTR